MYQFLLCPKCSILNMVHKGYRSFQVRCAGCGQTLVIPPPKPEDDGVGTARVAKFYQRRWFSILLLILLGILLDELFRHFVL